MRGVVQSSTGLLVYPKATLLEYHDKNLSYLFVCPVMLSYVGRYVDSSPYYIMPSESDKFSEACVLQTNNALNFRLIDHDLRFGSMQIYIQFSL